MPTGQGARVLADTARCQRAVQDASQLGYVAQVKWLPPAVYAQGRWPKGDFSYIKDPVLRESLVTVQEWVRALRHARSDRDLSIRQVAKELEMGPNAVSEIELGARWPALQTVLRMSVLLGVEIETSSR